MELSEVSNKTLVSQRLRKKKKKENEKLKGSRIERKKSKKFQWNQYAYIRIYVYRML